VPTEIIYRVSYRRHDEAYFRSAYASAALALEGMARRFKGGHYLTALLCVIGRVTTATNPWGKEHLVRTRYFIADGKDGFTETGETEALHADKHLGRARGE
jgi:hypothetical protein